jgi:OOP family OmpA-OmpF porin
MNNKVVSSILFILLLGWIAGVSYWFVCKMRDNCENPIELNSDETLGSDNLVVEKITMNKNFSINDGDVFNLDSSANISFSEGQSNLNVPDSLTKNFAAIQEYLSNNEDKNLKLTGAYTESEGSEVGMARANSLSDFFIANYGMEASRVSTSSKLVDELYINPNNSRTEGGVEFDFEKNVTATGENTDTISEEILAVEEPVKEEVTKTYSSTQKVDSRILSKAKRSQMVYYPPSGFDIEPNITDDLDSYFRNLKKYFGQNPDGVIEISGHSADGSNSYDNKKINEARARSMRNYLIKKYGISKDNLKIRGRGDSKLVDYSGSDMAKAKNRRITFKFIK